MTSYSEAAHSRDADGKFAPGVTGESTVDLDAGADTMDAGAADTALRDIDKAVERGKISFRRGNVQKMAVMGDFAAHLADTHLPKAPQNVTNLTFETARTIDQLPGRGDTTPATIDAKYVALAKLLNYSMENG